MHDSDGVLTFAMGAVVLSLPVADLQSWLLALRRRLNRLRSNFANDLGGFLDAAFLRN